MRVCGISTKIILSRSWQGRGMVCQVFRYTLLNTLISTGLLLSYGCLVPLQGSYNGKGNWHRK